MKRERQAKPVAAAAKNGPGWPIAALALAVLIAYSNSFHAGLIFDNAILFSQDARLYALNWHNLSLILHTGYWFNNPDTGLYRPLTTLSFLANYTAFGNGANPAAYHLVNLALHEINVLLVYILGLAIFGRRNPALALAAIWGLHPLHTEAITNVVGRADLLATCGVLGGLWCYIRWAKQEGQGTNAWLAGIFAAGTIAIFSKESGVVLPLFLALWDWFRPGESSWRRRIASYTAAILPVAIFLAIRGGLGIHFVPSTVDNPIAGAGLVSGRLTALAVAGRLLWLFVWPLRLSADYSYRAIPVLDWQQLGVQDVLALMTAVALLSLTLAALWRGRAWRIASFFLLLFWIAYLPTSNLLMAIGSIMAERFLYLPAVGLAGAAVAAVIVRAPVAFFLPQRAWAILTITICLVFAARTYARNFDWTDERTLWTSAVSVSGGSARAHNNLGTALPLEPARLPEIIGEFETAVNIRPDFAEAHNNLGNALLHMPGRAQDAISAYRKAIQLRPEYAEAHNNLANALVAMPGRLEEAIAEYRAVLKLRPDSAEAHSSLGSALLQSPGRTGDAISELQAALRLDPNNAEAHYNLGIAFLQTPDRLIEAVAEFEAALRSRPDFVEAHYNLGNMLLRVPDRLADAIGHYEAALRLEPDLAEGHYNLARALIRIPGRLPDAISELQKAVELRPDFAEAHYNLAMLLHQAGGREAEAAREYAEAVRLKPEFARAAHLNTK